MIKFKILKKDINRANKLLSDDEYDIVQESCPVALALKRKTHKKVSVSRETAEIDGKVYRLDYYTIKFIRDFDSDRFDLLKTPFYGTADLTRD